MFCDLRGFTAFTETVEPEDLMLVLGEYHAALGDLVHRYEGTLDRFTGDGLMAFFNDPLPCPDAPERAVKMAVAMRNRVATLAEGWHRMGHDLAFAVGVAQGHATLGRIGHEGRFDYTAIGNVTNLAARLCAEARTGPDPHQPARVRRRRGPRDRPAGRRGRPARVLTPDAGLQRARPRRGPDIGMSRTAASDPRLSDLNEHERGERFARLQERLIPVWNAMRLNEAGESIVVVPSVAPDGPDANGAQLQAYEERFLFLLLLLRHPRLQVIYVDRATDPREHHRVLPRPAARRHPAPCPRAPAPRRHARRLAALAGRQAARAAAHPGPDPRPHPRSHALPSDPVRHDDARARPRAGPRRAALRRRSPAAAAGHEDRLPAAVRPDGRVAPAGVRGRARPRGRRRRAGAPACGAARRDGRDRQAQRRGLGPWQRDGRAARAAGAGIGRGARGPARSRAGDGLRASRDAPRALPRPPSRGRRHRRGARERRRGPQPQRAAARDAAGRGRAALDARSAARRAERPELPGLPLPGRLRLRPRDHRGGGQDRRPARLRGRARALRGRLRRGARRARGLGSVRDRAQPAQGRHDAPVPDAPVPHGRLVRPRHGRCSRPRADARSTSWRRTTSSRSSCAG